MALTMTLPQHIHCPIASDKRGNVNATTSPDIPDAPLVVLRRRGLVSPIVKQWHCSLYHYWLIDRTPTTRHQQPKICNNFCTTFYDSTGYAVYLAKDYFQHTSTMEAVLWCGGWVGHHRGRGWAVWCCMAIGIGIGGLKQWRCQGCVCTFTCWEGGEG